MSLNGPSRHSRRAHLVACGEKQTLIRTSAQIGRRRFDRKRQLLLIAQASRAIADAMVWRG